MERLQSVLEQVQSLIGFVQFGALTVILTLQIVTRFVIQEPLLWSEEVARFLLFWLVMNGAALAVRRDRHFVLEIVNPERVTNRRLRFALQMVPAAAVFVVGLLMVVYGSIYAQFGSYRVVPISQINMFFVYLAIPLFGLWIVVFSIGQGLSILRAYRSEVTCS